MKIDRLRSRISPERDKADRSRNATHPRIDDLVDGIAKIEAVIGDT
ncbi:hypothetical protein [Sinorhizobium mexicanum]|nr:hypothetical protein [Sinorhizobium mexicanum]MBP1886721.1 hypothetical protein [Sinorhizobium mexicanum]